MHTFKRPIFIRKSDLYVYYTQKRPIHIHKRDQDSNTKETCIQTSKLPTVSTDTGTQIYVRFRYGVATVSRIDKIIGLFCKRDL